MNESPRRRIRFPPGARSVRPTRKPSESVTTWTVRSPVLMVVFTFGRCTHPSVSTALQMSGRLMMSCCGATRRTSNSAKPAAAPRDRSSRLQLISAALTLARPRCGRGVRGWTLTPSVTQPLGSTSDSMCNRPQLAARPPSPGAPSFSWELVPQDLAQQRRCAARSSVRRNRASARGSALRAGAGRRHHASRRGSAAAAPGGGRESQACATAVR